MHYLEEYFFNHPINSEFNPRKIEVSAVIIIFTTRMKFDTKNNNNKKWACYHQSHKYSEANEP